jgi:hypothetical protein
MATLVLEWADGEYPFALPMGQIEELQRVCGDIGFGAIYQRVMLGAWKIEDLYHTIRLGLIGAGMGQVDAARLVKAYFNAPAMGFAADPKDSCENVAKAVLSSVMIGVPAPFGEGKTKAATTSS